jgi:hypothetical protein
MNRFNDQIQVAKYAYFAQHLIAHLKANNIQPSPTGLATALNNKFNTTAAKPHTVRKWLRGETCPRSETLIRLAELLKIDPKQLLSMPKNKNDGLKKLSVEFDFADQKTISKYLAMTDKQKRAVQLFIEVIVND